MKPDVYELVRFFGSVVGTPGVSEKVLDYCNNQLFRLVQTVEPLVKEATSPSNIIS